MIIAGMHRAGTTLLARMLMGMGLFLGHRRDRNEEARTFQELNKWLLLQAGGAWDFPPPPSRFGDPAAVSLCLDFVTGITNSPWMSFYRGRPTWTRGQQPVRFDQAWGWKDPRNTVTLPLWARLYPDARVIYLDRHGVDVAASLVRRHQRRTASTRAEFARKQYRWWLNLRRRRVETARHTLEDALALWSQYQQLSQLGPDLFQAGFLRVRYEDLVTDPAAVMRRVGDHAGLGDGPVPAAVTALPDPTRAFAYRTDEDLLAFGEDRHAALAAGGYTA